MANLRLNKKPEAVEQLHQYIQRLEELDVSSKHIVSGPAWESTHKFDSREMNWAKRMLVKLQGMI